MNAKRIIFVDPGHGMSNRRPGVYDCGAAFGSITEAEIVMDWANELKTQLEVLGAKVIRSRINDTDPAPVGERADVARRFHCDTFISLHCNAADGKAFGTETFYRGAANLPLAQACNEAIVEALAMKDRGCKTESQSQHQRLAVLNFPHACLIELGFIDHPQDRDKLRDEKLMLLACQRLADAILAH
jgi:N-acetylmuramoyl-L-alanine amidase